MVLCNVDEIAEEAAKSFRLSEEKNIFVVKKDGQISVFENRCPHLGIPLEMMPDQFLDADKYFIQCSTHGALFETDSGLCVVGPCTGASLNAIPFELNEGEIHIKL